MSHEVSWATEVGVMTGDVLLGLEGWAWDSEEARGLYGAYVRRYHLSENNHGRKIGKPGPMPRVSIWRPDDNARRETRQLGTPYVPDTQVEHAGVKRRVQVLRVMRSPARQQVLSEDLRVAAVKVRNYGATTWSEPEDVPEQADSEEERAREATYFGLDAFDEYHEDDSLEAVYDGDWAASEVSSTASDEKVVN